MKKMSVFLLALATVGCAVALGGPEFSESSVAILKNGAVIKVIYQGPVESVVKVTILNADNQKVFEEKINSNGKFVRPYNLSELPEGDYKFCVDDKNGKHMETICSTDRGVDQVTDAKDTQWLVHVAKLNGTENKYMVSIPYQGDAEVAVSIYDKNQQLIFSEQQRIVSPFAKVYSLKNLDEASILVVNPSLKKEKRFFIE
ncbi:MAG TPA: hypothetical protein VKQ08_03625 [Cyclobacteriaceae bacterium]|nr:hypothetical protein [Cyclobacteriaceae bacterium]